MMLLLLVGGGGDADDGAATAAAAAEAAAASVCYEALARLENHREEVVSDAKNAALAVQSTAVRGITAEASHEPARRS